MQRASGRIHLSSSCSCSRHTLGLPPSLSSPSLYVYHISISLYVYHIYHMYTIYHYMYSTLSFGKPGEDEASSIYVQLFLEFLWTVFSSFLQLVVFLNFFQFSWRPLPFSFNSTPFVSLNQFVKQWNRGNLTFPRN